MSRRIIRNTLEHFPTISLFYRNIRDLLDQRQPALMTQWGFSLAGHKAMASGDFEPEETVLMLSLMNS